jgi:outer membrane protein assembly factor BamB/tetratricopeptide (TPR) repeat protein
LVERIAERLARWRAEAGLEPTAFDDAVRPPSRTFIDLYAAAPAADLSDVSRRPLAWVPLGGEDPAIEQLRTLNAGNAGVDQDVLLFAAPAVLGDRVIVNDGTTIGAWNRYTLGPQWSVRVDSWNAGRLNNRRLNIDDLTAVAAADGVVVAISEVATDQGPIDERVIVALDGETGRPLWRRTGWELGIPELDGAVVQGVPAITEGAVVLSAIRQVPAERLLALRMFALDLHDGALRWDRGIASSGARNWGLRQRLTDASTATGGLIVRGDEIGVVAAVEAATGRVRWARRIDEPRAQRRFALDKPWHANRPVVVGDTIYTVSPRRNWLIAFDRWTGEVVARRRASAFGRPSYLLVAGEHLVAVGPLGVFVQPLDDFGTRADTVATPLNFRAPDQVSMGRVIVSGDRLVVPVSSGAIVVEPGAADPAASRQRVPLERPGNLVALDGQLIVVDGERIQSYAAWRVAREELQAVMRERPEDPQPAITFARLAYHAGRLDAITRAVDAAIAAIEADPLRTDLAASRRELFVTLLHMIEPWRSAREAAEAGKRGANGMAMPAETRIAKPALRAALIRRLGAVAASPEERVAFLMAWGEHLASADGPADPAASADKYQRILSHERLAAATYVVADGRTTGAAIEATQRLRALIERHGPSAYAAFEREARQAIDAALDDPDADADRFTALSRRYPLADSAGLAWTAAALRLSDQQRYGRAVFAFEQAIDAAERERSNDGDGDLDTNMPAGGGDDGGDGTPSDGFTLPDVTFGPEGADDRRDGREQSAGTTPVDADEASAPADGGADRDGFPAERSAVAGAAVPTFAERVRRLHRAGPAFLRGALVETLAASGRLIEARRTLDELTENNLPQGLTIAVGGEALTPPAAVEAIAALADDRRRLPRIGDELGGHVVLDGWLLEPLAFGRLDGAPTDRVVMSNAAGDLGVFRAREGAPELLWRARTMEAPLAMDSRRVYTSSISGSLSRANHRLAARDLDTGDVVWQTRGIDDIFGRSTAGSRATVDLPLRARVDADEVDIRIGPRVIVMVERTGRVVAADRDSGAVLWTIDGSVDVVHDVALANGLLVIAGGDLRGNQQRDRRHQPEDRDHRIRIVETATGRFVQEFRPPSAVSWVALDDAGSLIVGAVEQVLAYDAQRGDVRWSIEEADHMATRAGVVVDGDLIIQTRDRGLIAVEPRTGGDLQQLDLGQLLSPGFDQVLVEPLDGLLAVTTGHGTAVLDDRFELLGFDDRSATARLFPARFAQSHFVTIDREGDWDDGDEFGSFLLRLHRLPGARLEQLVDLRLRSAVSALDVIDGYVLVSGMRNTLAVRAPSEREDDGG